MPWVVPAYPNYPDALSSRSQASGILIRQYQFPLEYDDKLDRLVGVDHDRLVGRDGGRAERCFRRHTRIGEQCLDEWLKRATDEAVIAFLCDLMQEERVGWTGYRVRGSVHQGNGWRVWRLELFAKHPTSSTRCYTGSLAPNVVSQ